MLSRSILVATDGSEASQRAEKFAADLASAIGICEVVVATVVPHREPSRGDFNTDPSDEELAEANNLLNLAEVRVWRAVKGSQATVRSLLITAHDAATGIVEASEGPKGTSLIVMGNRGLGGMKEFFLGSVSKNVLDKAHCPVMIVKG